MPDDLTPGWPSEDWLDFVLGVDHTAERVVHAFEQAAWNATPLTRPDPADPAMLDFLLGLDLFARRLHTLVDRCAHAGDEPLTGRVATPARATDGLLR